MRLAGPYTLYNVYVVLSRSIFNRPIRPLLSCSKALVVHLSLVFIITVPLQCLLSLSVFQKNSRPSGFMSFSILNCVRLSCAFVSCMSMKSVLCCLARCLMCVVLCLRPLIFIVSMFSSGMRFGVMV